MLSQSLKWIGVAERFKRFGARPRTGNETLKAFRYAILASLSLFTVVRADDLSIVATPSWVSEYMFRGQRRAGSSFQPQVEANSGGFAGGVWASWPTAARVEGQANPEVDGYASYTVPIEPNLSLQPGITVYDYAHGSGTPSAVEPNLALNWTADGVRLSPKVYEDLTRHIVTGEINAAMAVPLRQIGTQLEFGASLGAFSGRGTREDYWLGQVTLPYQLSQHARVSAGYGYSEGFSGTRVPLQASRGVVTVSLAYAF